MLLGILGGCLLIYSYSEATRITPIADVKPTLDGRTVIISGVVLDTYYDSRYEKSSFTVNDSTGTLDFYGWSEFTSALRAAVILPCIGDRIIVEGKVNVFNNRTSLEVSKTTAYKVVFVEAESREIGSFLLNDVGKKVTITGLVTKKVITYSGSEINLVLLTLKHQTLTATISVVISGDSLGIVGQSAVIPNATQIVRLTGLVTEYDGAIEIIPSNVTRGAIEILE